MQLFDKLMSKMRDDKSGAIPGAMGRLLATMGINQIGPHLQTRGIPDSVLLGCKPKVVAIPRTEHTARRKDGTVIKRKNKRGRDVDVIDVYGVSAKEWKKRLNDQKRRANGRWYSGETAEDRAKRLAARS